MKRWTAAGLALAIAVLSPGTGAYNAVAQTAARAGASGSATRLALPAAPLAAPSGLTASPLSTLPGASLTLPQVTLPSVTAPRAAEAARAAAPQTAAAAAAAVIAPTFAAEAVRSAVQPRAETAGRQAVTKEITSAVGAVAPLAETAAKGSLGQARASGSALEDILTRRASRRDADLVPAGQAWTSSLFGARRAGIAPASAVRPAQNASAPAAPAAKEARRSWRAAFGPVVRGLLSLKTAALTTALAIALHASASFAQLPFPTQVPIPAQTEMPIKRDEAVAPALQIAQAAPAPQAATAPDSTVAPAAAVQPAPVSVEAVVTGQGVTIGLPMTLTVTVRNLSGAPLTVPSVRGAIEEALPYTLEIRGQDDGAPLTLAAGETKILTFSVVPFDAGKIVLEGAELAFPTADPEKPLIVKIPAATFEVASVLTPDWKEKGFKDLAEIRRVELPSLAWLLALPLAGLALLGAERLLSARRRGRDPLVHNIPALDAAKARLSRLEAGAAAMDAREFHGETLTLLDRLLSDLRGLPRRERSMSALLAEAKDKYSSGQLTVARDVAAAAEAAVYDSGRGDSAETRRRALVALRELIADLAPAPPTEAAPSGTPLAGFGALLGGVSIGFAQPWALILAVPVAAWAFHKWRAKKSEAWVSPAAANAPAKGTWRARLSWIPSFFRAATIGLILLALSGPQIGVKRSETYVPSTDTMIASDISGSMSGERLEGLKRAVKDYLIEQRRGTQNRVGVVTFSDEAYLAVSLTTDYDALISRVKETQTEGSTAVGKGMMTAISHFLELNIMQMDAANPDVAEMRKLVLANDLAGALTYAKAKPGLMDKVLQPEKTKIVVIFTDGESNSGIAPAEAAKIAKQLGIKVYTVGIQIGGGESALKEVAALTGGLYFRAEDADGMRNALLDISRLEKSPALVRAQVAVNDLTTPLALLALLALLMEVGLVSTRFRSLPALMLAGLIGMNGVNVPSDWTGSVPNAMPVQTQVIQTSLAERLPLTGVPKDLAEGNALYLQGRYGDAVKRYSEALESHPDVPELYFNLGNAYLRSGDVERAARAYAKFLELTKDPKAASEAIYNLGNAAVMAKDAEKAIELYREALRKDPTNASAKWNLEVLNRLMEEQQKDQQDGKDKQKQKKGKKGEKKKGQKGEKGEKGDQKGEPGDEEGEPGDEPGKDGKPSDKQGKDGKPGEPKPGDAKPTPGEREKGVDGLIQEQGKSEKEGQEAQRGAVPRKGTGVWGFSLAGLGTAAAGFQAPLWLGIGLVALPVVAGLVIWAVNKKISAARKLAPAEAPKDLKSWQGKGRFWTKFSMLLAAVLGLALAAGDPIFGSKDTRLNFGGKDVVVASDVSASTLYAEDGRGARVQGELSEFVNRMQGTDRIGLVVFAGKPRTASPLSQDYGTFDFKVSRLEREARGLSGGSDLASAIEHSVKVFEGAKKVGERQRILIVVSDGEIFDQDLAKAVAAARKAGVTIFAIGVGDPAGTRIALPKADGSGTEFLIDEKTGQPALSKLYEAPLQKLASETGGAYFRSSEKVSMSDILGKVSEMTKGEETDAIKTPRGISFVFLTPALLLLLLEAFLPGVPLLRGRRQRAAAPAPTPSPKPVSREKVTTLHGATWAPLGAITISIWPALLPFALVAAALAGILVYDLSTRGALSRGVMAFLERKAPAEGLTRDLFALFDGPTEGRERWRETDHASVKSFVEGFKAASPESRAVLIRKAGEDAELWREKLVAAWLAESAWPAKNSDETRQAVIYNMAKAARRGTLPVSSVIERVLARRSELAWLDHPSVLRPLARLSAEFLDVRRPAALAALGELADHKDAQAAAAAREALPAARPAVQPTRLGRLGRHAAMAFLIATVSLSGVAGYKTVEFSKARQEAAQTALSIFYGDDLYIFTDQYADERINRDVLPVLKEWHATGKAPAAALAKALEVLRTSPDPKADNILETVFKRADLLPLTDASETLMLRTLIERDNDQVWRFLNEYMAQNGENPASAKRLVKMIQLGAEIGSEDVFRNLFHFLKSPNQQVKAAAANAIRTSLMAPEKAGQFAERLKAVTAKHQADPLINMWVAFFALDRLAGADASTVPVTSIDGVLSTALKAAAKADAARLGLIAQIKPGEEDKLPPPVMAQAFGLMDRSLDRAAQQGVNSDPLALASRQQVDEAVKAIIVEGVAAFPDLKARLIKDGVMAPDIPGSRYSGSEYDGYDDYHGHGGRFGGYSYSAPTPGYHDHYTKAQLAALSAAISEEAAKAGSSAKPEQREFADRALKVLEAATPVADKSVMPQGGTAAEAAAADMNQLLVDAHAKLPGTTALSEVRAAGLAPNANIGNDKDRSYRQAYTAEELVKLRGLFSDILARGETRQDGKSYPLTWDQKRFIADAVAKADALVKKHYPEAAAALPADELAAPLADVSAAVAKGDAAALAKALKSLEAAYAKAPVKDVVLARFQAAYSPQAAGYEDELRIQVLEFWLARLAADGAKLDVEGIQKTLDAVAPHMMDAKVALKAYDLLASALASAQAGGQDVMALRAFAQNQLVEGARRTLGGTKDAVSAEAYAAFQARLSEGRVLIGDNVLRAALKPVHLRALAAALDKTLSAPGEKAKTAKAWTTNTVSSLLKVAAAAGTPDGGSVPEVVADLANEALSKGDSVFPGHTWYDKLRAANLAPAGKGTNWEKDLPSSYSPAQVRALHAFITGVLASGQGWDYNGKASDMNAAQGRELAVMAERLDALMAKHYPKEAALTPAGLGRFVEGAAAGDVAARAGASARLAQAGSPAEVVALLDAASERVPGAAGQKVVADLLAEALAGRHGAALADKEELRDFVTETFAKQGAAVESELWNRLAQTAAKAGSPTLKAFLLKAVNQRVNELSEEVEDAEGAEERLIKAGLIRKEGYSATTREVFTQRHLIGFQGVTAAVLKQKDLKDEVRASAETASRVLPSLLRAGDAAGMPAGDDPASIAGERIGTLVAAGHQLFPGSRFIEELRAAKVVPNVPGASGFNLDRDVPIAWSKAEVVALRDFLKDILASGQGWDYSGGRKDLSPEEKALLESTVKELDEIVAGYSDLKAGPSTKSLNGFAAAGMALAAAGSQSAPVVASLSGILLPVLALVAAASVIWAVVRWFKASREAESADAAPLRTGPSEAVLARYKKLDLAAKKMASSLTEGKFRSRLIGAGGLTFAELANYQGEDVRAINWKASGKGDQLMVNRYEQEKDMPLILLVDLSASGEFAAAGAEKRQVIEDAAALLALTAARRNIRVGALFFTDRVEAYVPPAGGERHAWEIVRRALDTVPQGSKTDLRLALDFALAQAKSRAMVVLLSDLVADGWEQSLSNVAGRHDFRAVRVVDPAEAKPLPDAGLVLARDPETGVERWIDTGSAKVREAMGAEVKARERRIEAALTAARTSPITIYTDEDAVDELSKELTAPAGQAARTGRPGLRGF